MNLKVQLAPNNKAGLLLQNPVMTASGTFGYGVEYSQFFDIDRLAFSYFILFSACFNYRVNRSPPND